MLSSNVCSQTVKLTFFHLPDGAVNLTEESGKIESVDLEQSLQENRYSWSAPTRTLFSSSEEIQTDDGISITSSPGHRLLVRSLRRLLAGGDGSKSTRLDLDCPRPDRPNLADALKRAVAAQRFQPEDAERILSLRGGGFSIDSIHLSPPTMGFRKVTITVTRQPEDVEPENVQDEAEYV